MNSVGDYLISLLELYDVDTVFGIPGVHTAELYRGLAASQIRHVTPRHEQGAGFMADGYARVSGKPGVCLVITGPGLSNTATAMLQARADSVPMLVISGVNDTDPNRRGRLHEMPNQSEFAKSVAVESFSVTAPEDLEAVFQQAFTLFTTQRPSPVHIEIPLSVMRASCEGLSLPAVQAAAQRRTEKFGLVKACEFIDASTNPLILAGGGARLAAADVLALAEKLACPIVSTVNARALFPAAHRLHLAMSPSLNTTQTLISEADLVIAIGTELAPTDYDMYETGALPKMHKLLYIDHETSQAPSADLGLEGPAEEIVPELLAGCTEKERKPHELDAIRRAADQELSADYRQHLDVLREIQGTHPAAIIVGDSTQMTYAGNLCFASSHTGGWFNSSTGFGTLGYALPAALGAKLAAPEKPVIALVGDIGLQFVLAELGTLRDLGAPVIVLLWNNQGSGEIRDYMQDHDIDPEGVDIASPDFQHIAQAYNLNYQLVLDHASTAQTVCDQITDSKSALIEIRAL